MWTTSRVDDDERAMVIEPDAPEAPCAGAARASSRRKTRLSRGVVALSTPSTSDSPSSCSRRRRARSFVARNPPTPVKLDNAEAAVFINRRHGGCAVEGMAFGERLLHPHI